MAGTNEYKAFATGVAAYTMTPSAYAALTTFLSDGFPSGIVDGDKFNTVLRQACMVSAAMGKIVADYGLDALDNGDVATLASRITEALRATLAAKTINIIAGDGLTGGGTLTGSTVTLNVGTPGTCNGATGNTTTADSHTHTISAASTTDQGVIEIATSSEALGGSDTTRAVTSAGLASSKSITTNGYFKLPGGLIIQWGAFTVSGTSGSFSLPVTFPTAFLIGFGNGTQDRVEAGKYSIVGIGHTGTSTLTWKADEAGGSCMWIAIGH